MTEAKGRSVVVGVSLPVAPNIPEMTEQKWLPLFVKEETRAQPGKDGCPGHGADGSRSREEPGS